RERCITNRFIYNTDSTVKAIDTTSLLYTDTGKTPVLQAMKPTYPGEKFVIIGDGMNDYRAYESGAADLFIGFGGNVVREPVKAKAPHFAHSAEELLDILKKELQ